MPVPSQAPGGQHLRSRAACVKGELEPWCQQGVGLKGTRQGSPSLMLPGHRRPQPGAQCRAQGFAGLTPILCSSLPTAALWAPTQEKVQGGLDRAPFPQLASSCQGPRPQQTDPRWSRAGLLV